MGTVMKKWMFAVAMPAIWLALAPSARAQELSAQEVFKRVSPSVVVIEVRGDSKDGKTPNVIALGSGVVVPGHDKGKTLIATNCHMTDKSDNGIFLVKQGEKSELGFLLGRDAEMDLCVIYARFNDDKHSKVDVKCYGSGFCIDDGEKVPKKLPAVQIASSQALKVGDRVYAIGAPQGLELSLSEGLVSGLRKENGTTLIQTTAAISKGSSGGGLFDAQGRLVGITTMYLKDGQNLNFAIPAELIASVPDVGKDNPQPAASNPEPEPQPAPRRDRWVKVGRGDSSTAYVDTQTLQHNGTDVTVWVKHVLDKPETDKAGDSYDEELDLSVYHCASRQKTAKVYSQRLRGSPVWSHEYKSYEQERKSITPDTLGEAVHTEVCGP